MINERTKAKEMSKQNKYTKSARGQECQVRIPGTCNHNPETTVLAHLGGGGMGAKRKDIHGSYACSSCHDVIDHRTESAFPGREVSTMHLEGVIRTQDLMVANGILKL